MAGTRDIIGDLFRRNLVGIVEEILYLTDARTVSSCCSVCRFWEDQLSFHSTWKRMVEMRYRRDNGFRLTCRLNGWAGALPAIGGEEQPVSTYRNIYFKTSSFSDLITCRRLNSKKLFTGSMFSCLKLHGEHLFAGMLDGLVKLWLVRTPVRNEKPIRVFEGHEERVTALDARDNILLSSSIDHTVRIWSIETGGLLRVLRGPGSPILQVRFTSYRIISFSKSGHLSFWNWSGLRQVDFLYSTSVNHDHNFVAVGIDETFTVVLLHDPFLLGENELHVYCNGSGRRLPDKKITCPANVLCMDVFHSILVLGSGTSIEVWNLEDCQLVNTLRAQVSPAPTLPGVYVKNLVLSDYTLVAMLSSGNIYIWRLLETMRGATTEPNLFIDNMEPVWKNIALSDNKLAFGLEMKFGDIKLYSFSQNCGLNEDERIRSSKGPVRRDCRFSCCNLTLDRDLCDSIESLPDLK